MKNQLTVKRPRKSQKGFTLVELIVVSSISLVLLASGYALYTHFVRTAVVSVLSNAVMVNVKLIQAHYDLNGYWVTDLPGEEEDDPGNLTTTEELEELGLAPRNFSGEFIMRVFELEGFPNVIAREKIGHKKYGVIVSYHFKTRELKVEYK